MTLDLGGGLGTNDRGDFFPVTASVDFEPCKESAVFVFGPASLGLIFLFFLAMEWAFSYSLAWLAVLIYVSAHNFFNFFLFGSRIYKEMFPQHHL